MMIDIHSHILPNVDDGASSLDEACSMAQIAVNDGIKGIVCTPHLCSSSLDRDIALATDQLKVEFDKRDIDLLLYAGSENCASLELPLMKKHTLNTSSYCLVEFPHSHLPSYASQYIFELIVEGITPIIAHPERNGSILRDPKLVEEFVEQGALVQITAGSAVGDFGLQVQSCSKYLMKKRWVHFMATDAHSASGRVPVLSKGVHIAQKIMGKVDGLRLVTENPERMLAGEPVQ